MDNQRHLNFMRSPKVVSAKVLSSDGSWKLGNSDSDTSLTSSRGSDVSEICSSVAATDTTTMVSSPHPARKRINAHSISPTITDEEDPITVAVCNHQRVRSSQTLLSFDDLYGEDVYAEPQSSVSSVCVAYKRPVAVQVNVQQGRTSNSDGEARNQTQMRFRGGTTANTRNKGYLQSGDMKWKKPKAFNDTVNRLPADRYKPIVAKKSTLKKNKQIFDVYMSQANKVSNKPAPFQRKSSSFINRQAIQRETDRKNYMIARKLISVKAGVSTFR